MYLDELTVEHGETLPWEPLRDGFDFEGERVTLLGVRGIWKPQCLDLPISLRTSPQNPYGDVTGDDGLLHYRYYGTDIDHPDNAGLRSCYRSGLPLIYFAGVERGWYSPIWPMVLVNDDPGTLTFTGACDDPQAVRSPSGPDQADAARRQYVTRLALVRLHQARFRQVVLRAYRTACTVCQLGHMELLDAAHIVPDRAEVGGRTSRAEWIGTLQDSSRGIRREHPWDSPRLRRRNPIGCPRRARWSNAPIWTPRSTQHTDCRSAKACRSTRPRSASRFDTSSFAEQADIHRMLPDSRNPDREPTDSRPGCSGPCDSLKK